MSPMLGEGILPQSVNDTRRRVRSRLRSVREPVRSTRQDLVPGPDLIGRAESSAAQLRDRVVNRDGLLQRVRSQQQDMMNNQSDSSGSTNESNTPTT